MNYYLENASIENIDKIKEYKLDTIFEYAHDISQEEKDKIINYVNINVPKQIDEYKLIKYDNKIIGAFLLGKERDGILIDEIYLEREYRSKGIGTSILKNILEENNIVYLWVYKLNEKAVSLYKRLCFEILEETETRYFMKYMKLGE